MGIRDVLKPTPPVFSVPQPAKTAKASTVRPIVGSGEKINLRDPSNIENLRTRVYTEWQNDAWAYYDAIGEIKYGFGLVGAVMSRVRLYPALAVDKDAAPISTSDYLRRSVDQSDDEQAKDIDAELALPERITADVVVYLEELVADLFSGRGGQSSFMRNYALNICVAGECYLIQYKDQWYIKSTSEIVSSVDGKVILRRLRAGGSTSTSAAGGQPGDIELPKGAYVGRIWREHPRYSLEPESSMLGLREVCDELLVLQRMIRATARSRMNAGILFVPTGLSAAGSSVNEDVATDEESLDELMSDIYESISSSVDDETAASTVIPIGVSGPPEAADKLKLINLSRESDQFLVERCDRALERLLQGLDMPKDVVSGMANVKYSNAIQIDESLYKGHIEPLALMLVDALTTMYIHPALKKRFKNLTNRDLDFLRVWYDPSEVTTKSDPAASANTGYDNFAISAAAWRAAHGFSDTDAPTEHELAQRYLFLKGAPQPEQLGVLMKEAFPTITDKQRAANLANSPVPMPESAQEMLYGEVVAPADQTTRDGQNPAVTATESATAIDPNNPTGATGTTGTTGTY